jgi:hypothetical protein
MPRTRTTVSTTLSSSAPSPIGPVANSSRLSPNSNSMPPAGERLPLRPASSHSAFGTSRHKPKQLLSAAPGFSSPIQPRAVSSLFGPSAVDLSARSSAPTIASARSRPSILSPLEQQSAPPFSFPMAATTAPLSTPFQLPNASAIDSELASPGASPVALFSPPLSNGEVNAGPWPSHHQPGPWPRYPLVPDSSLPELPPFPFENSGQPAFSAYQPPASAPLLSSIGQADAASAAIEAVRAADLFFGEQNQSTFSAARPAAVPPAAASDTSLPNPNAATASSPAVAEANSNVATASTPAVAEANSSAATISTPAAAEANSSTPATPAAAAGANSSAPLASMPPPHVASAPHPSSSRTNAQPPLLPEAVGAGSTELMRAGEAPGFPPPSGSAAGGQVPIPSSASLSSAVLPAPATPISSGTSQLPPLSLAPAAAGPFSALALSQVCLSSPPLAGVPTRPPVPLFNENPASARHYQTQQQSRISLLSAQLQSRPYQPQPPPPPTPPPRVVLTNEAAQLALELHNGEIDIFQPLEGGDLDAMVRGLVAAVQVRFGATVTFSPGLAYTVLETARYLPGANGWPSIENALSCLRVASARLPSALNTSESSPAAPLPVPLRVNYLPQPPSAPLPSTGFSFVRRASGGSIQRLPPPHSSVNSNVTTSARFRNLLCRPTDTAPPTLSSRQNQDPRLLLCSSCGVAGHDAIQCPQGLDVAAIVDAAQDMGRVSQQRVHELSGEIQEGNASLIVREEVVESIAEISGISPLDVSNHLDAGSGDAELTFLSAVCHSRGGPNSQSYHDACVRELHRRRHRSQVAAASRQALSAPDNVTAYRTLASQVNLPAQLGYGYRMSSSDDLQLPPVPSKPVNLRRRRSVDDLAGFVVSDHSSVPEQSDSESGPPPKRRARATSAADCSARTSPSSRSRCEGSDGDDSSIDDDRSDNDSNHRSRSSADGDGENDENFSDSDSDNGHDSDDESGSDRDREEGGGGSAHRSAGSQLNPDAPLTAESLSAILKKLLDKRGRGEGNGLLASKTPSFWDLGKAPVGGYFAQTFMKVYGEYRQFKNVFGKKTGVTFKNLIMEDMIPMIRDDLKLSRREWRKIADKELIQKLKRRLGFRERDAYIAELESCPRLSSNLRDVTTLNTKFKEMAAQMLSICERARNHGVKLLKPSCKHVFSEAVKNCYRVNQWFRLRPFKSIGDSVRDINSKLSRRMASAAEQKHENAMDEAKLNGVRSQIGSGTTESSDAPDRKKGKVKGGIDKRAQDKSKSERDKHSKKMDALYKVENELPRGRFWHTKTPFCDGENCTLKICQGCGYHQVPGRAWHDRPRCNCRKHPEFVETGYFHDKYPNRLSIHDKSQKNSDRSQPSSSNNHGGSNTQRSPYAARSNSLGADKSNPGDQ